MVACLVKQSKIHIIAIIETLGHIAIEEGCSQAPQTPCDRTIADPDKHIKFILKQAVQGDTDHSPNNQDLFIHVKAHLSFSHQPAILLRTVLPI